MPQDGTLQMAAWLFRSRTMLQGQSCRRSPSARTPTAGEDQGHRAQTRHGSSSWRCVASGSVRCAAAQPPRRLGAAGLVTRTAPLLRCPARDGSLVQPQREAATSSKTDLTGRPVHDAAAGAWDALAVGDVGQPMRGASLPCTKELPRAKERQGWPRFRLAGRHGPHEEQADGRPRQARSEAVSQWRIPE